MDGERLRRAPLLLYEIETYFNKNRRMMKMIKILGGDTTWEMSWLTMDSFDPPNLRAWGRILISSHPSNPPPGCKWQGAITERPDSKMNQKDLTKVSCNAFVIVIIKT